MNRRAARSVVVAVIVSLCSLGLASQASADTTLSLGDARYLGEIIPGTPASEAEEAGYVTGLGNLNPGTNGNNGSGNDFFRSANVLCAGPPGNCPDATATGTFRAVTGDGDNINTTGFTYLLAKYGSDSVVWYVAGLADPIVDIPDTADVPNDGKSQSNGLSHYTLFNPGTTTTVPEPATVLLLGSAFAGIALVCRKLL